MSAIYTVTLLIQRHLPLINSADYYTYTSPSDVLIRASSVLLKQRHLSYLNIAICHTYTSPSVVLKRAALVKFIQRHLSYLYIVICRTIKSAICCAYTLPFVLRIHRHLSNLSTPSVVMIREPSVKLIQRNLSYLNSTICLTNKSAMCFT